MKIEPYLALYIKVNSKWVKDLNVSEETIKLLEGNIGINLHELRLGKGFLDDTNAQAVKGEKNR